MEGLEELRIKLDETDKELMRLFAERMELSERVAAVKRAEGMPIENREREEKVLASRTALLPEKYRGGGERLVRLLIEESKRVQRSALNLYLIGMPDSGKTRMAKRLREMIDLPAADTDRMIMDKTGKSIDELFASVGEEGFRDLESAALRAIAAHGGLIVAAGGGMPLREENALMMKSSGFTVFLDRATEKLVRQNTKNRPLIAADTPEETEKKVLELCAVRRSAYLSAADLIVDPDSPGAAEAIAEAYKKAIE